MGRKVNLVRRVVDSDVYSDEPTFQVLREADLPAASPRGEVVKRITDCCLSLILLPAALIFALPIALLIALQGGRPIYRHLRVGRSGQPFYCYKFRTMVVDADEKLQALLRDNPNSRREWFEQFKLKDDPRVTRLGSFLRKSCLDEIPQIWNVIRGDMSWVGPRPVIPDELVKYGPCLSAYLACRPGITGLWQVNRHSDTSYAERIQYDVQYLENWSTFLDLKILLMTIPRIVTLAINH